MNGPVQILNCADQVNGNPEAFGRQSFVGKELDKLIEINFTLVEKHRKLLFGQQLHHIKLDEQRF